jgi:hypothetical protein
MGMNMFGNRNFMQPFGRLTMHSCMIQFFLVERGEDKEIFSPLFLMCSHKVCKSFPSSQNVSKCAPQYVPNKKVKSRNAHFFQLGSKEVLQLGHAQCFKKIANGPINIVLKKKLVNAPMI